MQNNLRNLIEMRIVKCINVMTLLLAGLYIDDKTFMYYIVLEQKSASFHWKTVIFHSVQIGISLNIGEGRSIG